MQRLQGYKIAMSENGLNPDTNYIVYPKDYKKLCDSIISKNEPSAIVVAKSEYAHKIMTILHKSSIKIPEQISIIACNNMPYNDYLFPPLTSKYTASI
jgi:DNA-binding LacI/PurR family transcriptional regulator